MGRCVCCVQGHDGCNSDSVRPHCPPEVPDAPCQQGAIPPTPSPSIGCCPPTDLRDLQGEVYPCHFCSHSLILSNICTLRCQVARGTWGNPCMKQTWSEGTCRLPSVPPPGRKVILMTALSPTPLPTPYSILPLTPAQVLLTLGVYLSDHQPQGIFVPCLRTGSWFHCQFPPQRLMGLLFHLEVEGFPKRKSSEWVTRSSSHYFIVIKCTI